MYLWIDTQSIVQDLEPDVVQVEVNPDGDVGGLGLEAVLDQLLDAVPGTEHFVHTDMTHGVGVKSFHFYLIRESNDWLH